MAVDELMEVPPDIVLTFLPTYDRKADDNNSLYAWVYSRLLRREIASQVIYEDTPSWIFKPATFTSTSFWFRRRSPP